MGRYPSLEFRNERGASARKNTPVFESLSFNWSTRLSWGWQKAGGAAERHAAAIIAQTGMNGIERDILANFSNHQGTPAFINHLDNHAKSGNDAQSSFYHFVRQCGIACADFRSRHAPYDGEVKKEMFVASRRKHEIVRMEIAIDVFEQRLGRE